MIVEDPWKCRRSAGPGGGYSISETKTGHQNSTSYAVFDCKMISVISHSMEGQAMHHFLWVVCLTSVAQAAVPTQAAQIRPAIEKSIILLQNTGKAWFAQQSCTSCHHSILPAIALMTARRHGIAIDESLARDHFRQAFRYLTDLDFLAQGIELEGLRPAAYALWGAHEAGLPQNQASAALARVLASQQTSDGHWRSLDVRPPQSGSLFSNTALYVQAINWYYGTKLDSKTRERISRARRWFETNVPASTEDWAFRLIGAKASGVPILVRKKWGRQLITLQAPDGGWSQITSKSSDAYATGEVLVALIQGAGIPIVDPAIQKGLEYLIKTQLADGSWLVQSRIHDDAPLSPPYFESGFPHGKNQFTSSSGTSWAVFALSLALPESAVEPFSLRDLVPPQERWVDVALFGSLAELKKLDPNRSTAGGTTVLMLVASDIAKVKTLLDRDADVNARAKSGWSPLIVACSYGGNADVIRLLLDRGAQIRPLAGVKVLFNQSPLIRGVFSGDLDQIKLLVNQNSDVRQKSLLQRSANG